jgi:hypothetical protein
MNLWYAGPVVALIVWWRGGHPRTLSRHLMKHMPIIIAYGVNFGIVPLLFVQVAYYRVFYPSTILMAWPWFSVFILLTLAYYGIYIYALGLNDGEARMTTLRRLAGWIAASVFIVIGFIFANEFSLMTNLGAWHDLWASQNVGGAVLGLKLNLGDPTLWPRWLMMFGLALTTTAAYVFVDAGLFSRKENQEYRKWASVFALKLYSLGIIWFAAFGSWYVFGTWAEETRKVMLGGPLIVLSIATAFGPGLPWLLMAIFSRRIDVTRPFAIVVGLAQFGVIAINAVSRQIVQNIELGRFLDVTSEKVNMQWSPLVIFLVLFILGLALIFWMIRQAMAAGVSSGADSSPAR